MRHTLSTLLEMAASQRPSKGLAVSYDLINFVEKLHKVRKNPERALHVVKGDLANFFGFHRFGIKESAVMPQRGREGTPRRVFVFHGIYLNCEVGRDGSTDLENEFARC